MSDPWGNGYQQAIADLTGQPESVVVAVWDRMYHTFLIIADRSKRGRFRDLPIYYNGYMTGCRDVSKRLEQDRRKSLFCGSKL